MQELWGEDDAFKPFFFFLNFHLPPVELNSGGMLFCL